MQLRPLRLISVPVPMGLIDRGGPLHNSALLRPDTLQTSRAISRIPLTVPQVAQAALGRELVAQVGLEQVVPAVVAVEQAVPEVGNAPTQVDVVLLPHLSDRRNDARLRSKKNQPDLSLSHHRSW